MINKELIDIINNWDPIGFFPMAPKNEYYGEIMRIQNFLENTKFLGVNKIATKINEIFVEEFGDDVYKQNLDDCIKIANEIMRVYNLF